MYVSLSLSLSLSLYLSLCTSIHLSLLLFLATSDVTTAPRDPALRGGDPRRQRPEVRQNIVFTN